MSFLPNIFNRAPAPAATPAATPAAPAAPQGQTFQQQNPATGGGAGPASKQGAPANPASNPANMNGSQPVTQNAGGPETGAASALDAFRDHFKAKPVDPNAVKKPTLQDPYLPALDPADIQQRLQNTNFAAAVPQETMQKAISGDPQAFAEALNIAAREAFAASTQLSHSLVDHGARAAAERVDQSLDSRFRGFALKSQTISNETLAHPSVAPAFQAIRQQFANANPHLNPEQVTQETEKYFTEMAKAITSGQQGAAPAVQSQTPAGTNFASYL